MMTPFSFTTACSSVGVSLWSTSKLCHSLQLWPVTPAVAGQTMAICFGPTYTANAIGAVYFPISLACQTLGTYSPPINPRNGVDYAIDLSKIFVTGKDNAQIAGIAWI
jgi:hypothetical protein